MMGGAGAIIGFLALADALSEPPLVERAVATGDELLAGRRAADTAGHGQSRGRRSGVWPRTRGGRHRLGTARAVRRDRRGAISLRRAGAFAYERSWLDPTSGTWPDLRIAGQRRGRPGAISATTGSWCRGEAGIAQTRLRAVALYGVEADRRDADVALGTTRRHVVGLAEIEDLSLCHGAAGSADVLRPSAVRRPRPSRSAIARSTRYGDGNPWPCGVPGGVTPGLFLGLSGIGWWLLRLHDARIPSPLGTWGLTAASRAA